jgi:hypothetical protein
MLMALRFLDEPDLIEMYCLCARLSNVKGALGGAELHSHFTATAPAEYAFRTLLWEEYK